MNDLTLATVNYNTPLYVYTLLSSIKKSNPWYTGKLHVYDNGTTHTVIDGTHDLYIGHHINSDFYSEFDGIPEPSNPGCRQFASAKHCKLLNKMFEECQTRYLLLLNSDVIVTETFEPLLDKLKETHAAACGYIRHPAGYKPRLAPWFSFIDTYQCKDAGIAYYDTTRILFINGNMEYDTGASFLEDCRAKHLIINELPSDNMGYYHFKGGSYSNQDSVLLWLHKHELYWR